MNTKFAKEQFEEQRSRKTTERLYTGGATWASPTYMDQLGIGTTAKNTVGDYTQYIKNTLKPGQLVTDKISTRPTEIVLPGTGFGNGSIHGMFLSKQYCNLESRLRGLGLSHPRHPAPPPQLTPMRIKTLHTNPPAPYVTAEPVIVAPSRPLWWEY